LKKLLLLFFFLLSLSAQSQVSVINDAAHPCITKEEYVQIEKDIAWNCKRLGIISRSDKTSTTLFSWPLRVANGFDDCGYYLIVNYVDQDVTSGIRDYNCGSVTYDGHTGTDIVIEPYPFYKMDNDEVEVIAAAAGTIVSKSDGNFDKNCSINSLTANSIIIQHADGSEALYWHMKKNSLTSKTVGQTVAAGEFLGRVGSSGSSTLPHLHFEVWGTSSFSSRQDPYAGPCNLLNANTWWANQKPYKEPAIIKLQVNHVAPVLPACPATETLNEDSCFTTGGTALFYTWIRNDTIGMTTNMRIINPNSSTFSSWSHNSTTTFNLAAYSYTRTLPSAPGVYTFEAVFNGDTCTKKFIIDCSQAGIYETGYGKKDIRISPNPFHSTATLSIMAKDFSQAELKIYNILGEEVKRQMITEKTSVINRDGMSDGIYFIRVTDGENAWSGKMVVE